MLGMGEFDIRMLKKGSEMRMAKQEYHRFVTIHENRIGMNEVMRIIVDRETLVQYLSNVGGSGKGLTILVGQDGKPLLYQPQDKND